MSRDNTMTVLVSLLVGGLVGAGAAILLAPQSGKKTRKMIVDFADDMKEHAEEYAERIKEKVA